MFTFWSANISSSVKVGYFPYLFFSKRSIFLLLPLNTVEKIKYEMIPKLRFRKELKLWIYESWINWCSAAAADGFVYFNKVEKQ